MAGTRVYSGVCRLSRSGTIALSELRREHERRHYGVKESPRVWGQQLEDNNVDNNTRFVAWPLIQWNQREHRYARLSRQRVDTPRDGLLLRDDRRCTP